eukprot:700541-Pelagomonas_calceolata.AAC.2
MTEGRAGLLAPEGVVVAPVGRLASILDLRSMMGKMRCKEEGGVANRQIGGSSKERWQKINLLAGFIAATLTKNHMPYIE